MKCIHVISGTGHGQRDALQLRSESPSVVLLEVCFASAHDSV